MPLLLPSVFQLILRLPPGQARLRLRAVRDNCLAGSGDLFVYLPTPPANRGVSLIVRLGALALADPQVHFGVLREPPAGGGLLRDHPSLLHVGEGPRDLAERAVRLVD